MLNTLQGVPGVNDDASSVELARVMAAATYAPEMMTLFVMVAGEEQGLLGSNFVAT